MRPPRPRQPSTTSTRQHEERHEDPKEQNEDAGYESCEDMHDPAEFSAALVDAAAQIVEYLKTQDEEAAAVVQELCNRLSKKERQVQRQQKRLREARVEHEQQKSTQADLQGQSARHWWHIQRLKSQLDFAGYRNSELRRQLWWLKQGLPPELKRKR